MVGHRAAYATPSPDRASSEARQRSAPPGERTGVHAIRKGQLTRGYRNNQQDDVTSGDSADDSVAKRSGYSKRTKGEYDAGGGIDGGDDDDDDGFDEEDEEEDEEELHERERELLREREEMKARFTFQEYKRRNLKQGMMDAMRRKRRMLMRNENLRFRELYKPPEPQVVITVIALVTIVTLILTKSWPFY